MSAPENPSTEWTLRKWLGVGLYLFGTDRYAWRFKCPKCGEIESVYSLNQEHAPHQFLDEIERWVEWRCYHCKVSAGSPCPPGSPCLPGSAPVRPHVGIQVRVTEDDLVLPGCSFVRPQVAWVLPFADPLGGAILEWNWNDASPEWRI